MLCDTAFGTVALLISILKQLVGGLGRIAVPATSILSSTLALRQLTLGIEANHLLGLLDGVISGRRMYIKVYFARVVLHDVE